MNKNIPYYLTAVGLFVLLKLGFTFADNNDLAFLLKPTAKLIELLTGSHAVYFPDRGYYYEQPNILIEKSCAGCNFWILSFLVFSYLALKYFDKPLHKILVFPTALVFAYFLTVFANTSRIFTSIVVRNQTVGIFSGKQALIHEMLGITTCFPLLVLVYFLIEKLFKHKNHAKLA